MTTPSIRTKLYTEIAEQRARLNNPEVKAALRVLDRLRKWKGLDISVSNVYGFNATVIIKQLDGFKDRRLLRLLEALDPVIAGEWRTVDDTAFGSRDFTAALRSGGRVSVIAKLSDTPEHCRVVEISRTKRIEEREDVQRIFVCL